MGECMRIRISKTLIFKKKNLHCFSFISRHIIKTIVLIDKKSTIKLKAY